MPGYKVAISSDFFSAFAALPKSKQGRVMDFISKFRSNPMSPGLNYEKINDASDKNMRSVRIDDAYRAIVMRDEDCNVMLLLWVDHHDEAYNWARRRRCLLNQTTGSIQVYETAEETQKQVAQAPGLFSGISDKKLKMLGVPDELINLTRSIQTETDLNAVQNKYPRDAFEALDLVSDGCDVDEVIDLLYGESGIEEHNNIDSALDNPITRMQFTVAEGEEELKAMMNAPLEKWRVFLHPSQRRIANKMFSGPVRVLGGAGTGKTVVAMHRAKYLARQCNENERVLFTTFTANLAQDIKENLRKICSSDEMRKIEVIHLDAWISRFLQQHEYEYTIKYGDDLVDLWETAYRSTGEELDFPDGFFEDEWSTVVQAQGISSIQEYVQASRAGRGVRLDRKKRIDVWKVFEEYRTLMNINKVRDSAAAMNECCDLLKAQPDYHPYKSILVDESQDFGMGAFRLLRTLAGEQHENDLFIVGDAHQRIYRNKVILSRCGISVRGRSSYLRINYRTTEEIRDWAMYVLKGIPFDDLDGGIDDVKGYRSLSHGEKPIVENFETFANETAAIIGHVKEKIDGGMAPIEICVVARTSKTLDDYAAAFAAANIKTYEIKRTKTDNNKMPGVRLATMHRVKGLEFTCVIIAGMTKNSMPLKSAVKTADPVCKQEALTAERCLLYVALTRAKKITYVTSYGQASEFLE